MKKFGNYKVVSKSNNRIDELAVFKYTLTVITVA